MGSAGTAGRVGKFNMVGKIGRFGTAGRVSKCQILLIKDYLMKCLVSTSGLSDWLRDLHR